MCSCKKAARKSKNTLEKDSGGKSGGLHCVYRQKDVRTCTCTSLISCENECVLPDCSASVKGNLIRAHTDPGGMNPPAESVRRIGSSSGFNPSSQKCKHTVKKIHLEMMCLSWHLTSLRWDNTSAAIKCFQKKEMQPFPLTRTAPHHQNYFPFSKIELFCSCQMPETYSDMIECGVCGTCKTTTPERPIEM